MFPTLASSASFRGKQKIARVSFGHFDQLAARAELFHVFLQNNLHVPYPVLLSRQIPIRKRVSFLVDMSSAANGSSAIFCARLMATVSHR